MKGVEQLFCELYKMSRRKRVVPEGIVLDLTNIPESDIDIDALIAEMQRNVEPEPPIVQVKTDEEILDEISDKHHCHNCRRSIFSDPKVWKETVLCENCHKRVRMREVPRELTEYIRNVYRRGCSFCDIKDGRFHLDHINMFSKIKSVYELRNDGAPAEVIIAEIDKCQLLCVNCHGLVTKFELKRGFIKQKRILNKKIAAGENVTDLRGRLYAEYEAVMTKMYPLIREKAMRVWDDGEIVNGGCGN